MNMLWSALVHTPWWVYALLIYLITVGVYASKTRVVSLKKLFVLPAIFLAMSVNTFISSVQIHFLTISAYLLSLLLGIGGGWMLVQQQDLKIDKQRDLIQIPGSWVTLVLTLIIFAAKYYFGYALATDPEKAHDTFFEIMMLGVSGICTGLFMGRLGCYLVRRNRDPHHDLA